MQTAAIQPHRQSVTSIVYCQSATNGQISRKVSLLENRSQLYVHVKRFVLHTASSSIQHLCRCTEMAQK